MVKEYFPCCHCCEFASTAHIIGTYRHSQPCNRHQPELFRAWSEKPEFPYLPKPKKVKIPLPEKEIAEGGQLSINDLSNFRRTVKLIKAIMKEEK